MQLFLATFFCAILGLASSITVKHTPAQTNKGRIVGGANADAGQFPFAAAINVQTDTSRFMCTGAFIGFRFVLTSGNCVNDGVLFTVRLGATTLNDPDALVLATSDYLLHPDFDAATITGDVGLIEFREDIRFTEYIRPIYAWVLPMNESQSVKIIGWGQTSDEAEGYSNTLLHADATSLTNEVCRRYYGNQVTESMVCVEGNYNEGTCIGDNGGPLFLYIRGSAEVVAISSFISGNGCNSIEPSGFTRLQPYVAWVRLIVYGIDTIIIED